MNTDGVVERLDIFKNQLICMCIIENFETINPLSFFKGHGTILCRHCPMDKLSWNSCESFQRLPCGMPLIHIGILSLSQ